MTLTLLIVITDSQQLKKMETSKSLFLYEKDNNYILGVIVNFSNSESKSLSTKEIKEIKTILNTDKTKLKEKYFKIFIFKEEPMEKLLPKQTRISSNVKFPKKVLLDGLNNEDLNLSSSYFITIVLSIFQNIQNKEVLLVFLNEYKADNIKIYPPIKAISLLSSMPESILNKVVLNMPEKKEEYP
ncbi:MAG: hypothetical protein Q8Q42_00380 [Nanoarchaeota archaeon]|nr:hypothetical protein [Nanoarchaeota archaeon]